MLLLILGVCTTTLKHVNCFYERFAARDKVRTVSTSVSLLVIKCEPKSNEYVDLALRCAGSTFWKIKEENMVTNAIDRLTEIPENDDEMYIEPVPLEEYEKYEPLFAEIERGEYVLHDPRAPRA